MIERTSELGLIVTGITCAVGVVMFLLPPVPGVPVYLTLGIVLTAWGYGTMGWVNAVLFLTAVGTGLKIFSSALQQKLIVNESHEAGSWKERAQCPESGDFDWWPRLAATGNPEIPWSGTATTICASLTAAVQFGSMIVAAYYLDQASEQRRDEVDTIKIDKKVQETDERDEHLQKCYTTAMQWRSIPIWSKVILERYCTYTNFVSQTFPSMDQCRHQLACYPLPSQTDTLQRDQLQTPECLYPPTLCFQIQWSLT
eukprot:CCRYP_002397-RA/>CCRYP_002397-RA protein AED:0.41 eAED:0.51 QI:0/0/0/0.8/1/1/5/0/255